MSHCPAHFDALSCHRVPKDGTESSLAIPQTQRQSDPGADVTIWPSHQATRLKWCLMWLCETNMGFFSNYHGDIMLTNTPFLGKFMINNSNCFVPFNIRLYSDKPKSEMQWPFYKQLDHLNQVDLLRLLNHDCYSCGKPTIHLHIRRPTTAKWNGRQKAYTRVFFVEMEKDPWALNFRSAHFAPL